MIYNSTRNNNLTANSAQAVLKGIADDGGLFMIKDFSSLNFDYKDLLDLTTMEMSEKILGTLLDDLKLTKCTLWYKEPTAANLKPMSLHLPLRLASSLLPNFSEVLQALLKTLLYRYFLNL